MQNGENPIIFALANPDPEILPDEAQQFEMILLWQLDDQIFQTKLIMF